MTENPAASPDVSANGGSAVGWAIFLACSWTWCIGMFLPVLLVRDLGIAGWVIFAIPNIVGAAAMGWVLKTARSSDEMVRKHRPAAIAFSAVTVAFHVFFLFWFIASRLLNPWWIALASLPVILVWISTNARRDWPILSIAVYVLSLLALVLTVLLARRTGLSLVVQASDQRMLIQCAYLAPVCIFGFVLCPYLDLTFHRARQACSARQAAWAFSLGFGLFFLIMIVFTLIYSGPLVDAIRQPAKAPLAGALAMIIGIHMLLQSGLTMGLHTKEISDAIGGKTAALLLLAVPIFIVPSILGGLSARPHLWFGIDSGEVVYRAFMGFYGLVFPAYVYLCIGSDAPAVRKTAAFVLAVLVAGPFFWLGFVQNRMILLLPGLGIVLLSRLLLVGRRSKQ